MKPNGQPFRPLASLGVLGAHATQAGLPTMQLAQRHRLGGINRLGPPLRCGLPYVPPGQTNDD